MSKSIIQCDTLGKNGFFANSVIQYLVAKALARHFDAKFEINHDWIGTKIFNITCDSISCKLPRTSVDEFPSHPNVNVYGYFQHSSFINLISKNDLKEWLVFNPNIQSALDEFKSIFSGEYAIMHKRDGDYKSKFSHLYCIPTYESYFAAHAKYSPDIPLSIVSEENGYRLKCFDGTGLEFLPDFFAIMNADVIYRANSTFSWLAAEMAIKPNVKIYSPKVGSLVGESFVEFVPGNSEMFMNPLRFGTKHDRITFK